MNDHYQLHEDRDVNHWQIWGRRLRTMIRMGRIEQLRQFVSNHPSLDLSRFPGEWNNPTKLTPIAFSVLHEQMEIFKFLLSCQVDLEILMVCHRRILPPGQFHIGTNPPMAGDLRPRQMNLLSFCLQKQSDSNKDFFKYAYILSGHNIQICNTDIEIDAQPVLLFCLHIDYIMRTRHFYRDNILQFHLWDDIMKTAQMLLSVLLKKEIVLGTRSGASILMRIFCENLIPPAMYRLNLLGIVIELMLMHDIQFDIDLYDLDRLYYDKRTKHIFEILEQRQVDRNLAIAQSLHYPGNSPLSKLNVDLLRNILEGSMQPNLAKMDVGECCVCFDRKNLHQVCKNRHQLCPACRLSWLQQGKTTCPSCRAPMFAS